VGYYENPSYPLLTLTEKWNGSSWSIQPSPNVGHLGSELDAVSCTSSSFCAAVGERLLRDGYLDSLAEIWNGKSWSSTHTTNESDDNFLLGVSCTGPFNCVAAGRGPTPANSVTLIESWNGTTWSTASSPDPSRGNDLYDVSCTGFNGCEAVGSHSSSSGRRTLVVTGS
jgi:hypothetical protein